MKLLAVEANQFGEYYRARYRQVVDLGVDLYVLNGTGTPDFWPADRYRLAGTDHVDELIRQAKSWHADVGFDGVLTFAECAVIATAAVADALGLPGIGVEAAVASRNKLTMRRAYERGGAASPRYRLVGDLDAALAAAAEFGYPAILKPTLGSASSFVFRVDGPEQLRERYAQARAGIDTMGAFTMEAEGVDLGTHGLLLEEFLDGHEHLIEAVVWDGEVFLGSIVDRITVEGDTFDDDVHHAPTVLTQAQIAAVHETVAAGVRAQGLVRSVLHAEVRFHRGAPHLLEIAVRPGGGGLDHMARRSAGHDPIRATVDVARGVRPDVHHFHPTGVHTVAMCLLCEAGTIETLEIPQDVAADPRLLHLKISAKPGDVILRPPLGNNVLGGFGVTGASFDEAMGTAAELAERIRVTVR
jgi:biotin carboxylase